MISYIFEGRQAPDFRSRDQSVMAVKHSQKFMSIFLDDQNQTADALLAKLDEKEGGNWLTVARVLTALEAQSRRGPDGRVWLDIVMQRLEQTGQKKTPGHLRKMRRAFAHLRDALPHLDLDEDTVVEQAIGLTALETAERIARLDRDAGRAALRECITGASSAKLQQMYDAARAEHADQMTARQLAWETRRQTSKGSVYRDTRLTLLARNLEIDTGKWWGMPCASVKRFSPDKLYRWLRSPDESGFALTTQSGEHSLGAVRTCRIARGDRQSWHSLLEAASLRSSLLDRYWLIVDADHGELEDFSTWLDTLALTNVGIAQVTADGEEITCLRSAEGAPVPDRRGLIRNALLRRSG